MLKTPLHAAHIALGAKMGEFSGYDMPLYYGEGVLKEHEWTRSHTGLFDVSHMGQVIVDGPGATDFLQHITPSAFDSSREGAAKYTVLTNEAGGILDDLIITRIGVEKFFVVLNAGRKHQDIAWMQKHLPPSVTLDYSDEQALIALQGPEAEQVLKDVFFFDSGPMNYM
ncbi:MAG TPA: glycine cleavage system protein T, partial [Micavibrio sp.]